MKPGNGTNGRGEKLVALLFVCLIFLLGAATARFSIGAVVRQALAGFCDDPGADVSDRIRRAIKAGEAAFTETMGRKLYLAGLDTNLRFFLTKEITSQEVMLGKEGWLFYKTKVYADPIGDYQGANHYPEHKLKAICEMLQRVEKNLSRRGIRFLVMIPPNKSQIYGNFMPESVRKVHERSRADLLVEYVKGCGGIIIIYPKEEFLELRDRYQLYYKHDTHWNELGAWVAAQQLRDQVYGQRDDLEKQAIDEHPASFRDLANMISMQWYFTDDREYCVRVNTEPAIEPGRDRLLWVGDSFQTAMAPVLRTYFQKVTLVSRRDFDVSLLDDEAPDIVVLQYVERSLDDLLPEESLWQRVEADPPD